MDNETDQRLVTLEARLAKVEADEWHKSGMAVRGMLVLAYQFVLLCWAVLAVLGVLGVAWLISQLWTAL